MHYQTVIKWVSKRKWNRVSCVRVWKSRRNRVIKFEVFCWRGGIVICRKRRVAISTHNAACCYSYRSSKIHSHLSLVMALLVLLAWYSRSYGVLFSATEVMWRYCTINWIKKLLHVRSNQTSANHMRWWFLMLIDRYSLENHLCILKSSLSYGH